MEIVTIPEERRDEFVIASGSAHPELGAAIAQHMGLELTPLEIRQFPDGEIYVRHEDSIRERHAFVVQTHVSKPGFSINDALMEHVLMIDAACRASARQITAVSPYIGYGRQDRKAHGGEPISAAVVVRQLGMFGARRIAVCDMHSAQIQAVHPGPFDHMTVDPILVESLQGILEGEDKDDYVIVAPDAGRAKVVEDYSEWLDLDVVFMTKSRDRNDSKKVKHQSVDDLGGKTAIIIDDMIGTGGTLASAARHIKEAGVEKIIAATAHPLFSGEAIETIMASTIDLVVGTNTVPTQRLKEEMGDRIVIVDAAPLIADSLSRIAMGISVSEKYGDRNNR